MVVDETPEPEAPVVKEPEKGKFIPKARFDDAVRKERDGRELAERQLAELQSRLQQSQRTVDTGQLEAEIKGLEKQYTKLILQGDEDAAAEVMSQVRLKERTVAIQEATHLSAQAKNEAREEIRMDTAIEALESTYATLNPADDSYDQEKVEDVLGWQQVYITRDRLTPAAALVKAAEKVMRPVAASEDEGAKGLAAGKVAADRKGVQVAKSIDAATRQPASMKNSGLDSDKAGQTGTVEYSKLTAEERAAMPAATRARLRGDMV